jgi:hypothetical protein
MSSKPKEDTVDTGKKTLTEQEMKDAGIVFRIGPDSKPTKRVKLKSRKEKPVTVLPPRGVVWYND